MRLSNSVQKFIILTLTLLAFLLRAYRLESQSYWIEEAWTLYYTHLPLDKLWHILLTQEPKPPFYYFATLYWIKLVGDSEYALRFFSLVFGVMAVPLTYRLGKALGDDRLGLLTALLMTVAPYQIWHSQEARMYSIFTAASVMSMWGFIKMLPDLRGFQQPMKSAHFWQWWLIYVVGTEWAILTHYHALVVIGSQGLFLLLTWRRHWRGYLPWAATLSLIVLLYAPWLVFGSALLQRFLHWLPQPTLWETFTRGAQAYTVGEYMPPAEALPLVLVFVAVYLLGLIYAAHRRWGAWRGPEMLAFLLAFTLAPNVATWLYGELRTPVYFERYLIPIQVGFLLAVAMGILAIYDLRFTIYDLRFWTKKTREPSPLLPHTSAPLLSATLLPATLLLVTLLTINGYALWQHYFNPAYAKDDWRAVIRKIEAFELPGDAIILTGDGGEKLFDYYYRGHLPVYRDFLLPAIPSSEEAIEILAEIVAKHRRIWYTPYGVDLDPPLESWLAEHAYPAWHSWLGRKRLALYAGSAAVADRLEELDNAFLDSQGNGPKLVSLSLASGETAAGDVLPLQLTWQTDTPLPTDYQLSLRLLNSRGDIFTQSDWPPLNTSTWPPHQPITDRRSLWLPPDLPPGEYALQLVVYNPTSGESLGQPLVIPAIPVAPATITPPLEALSIPNHILSSSFILHPSSFQLVGYILPDQIQPGQEMWLWLYWQMLSPSLKGGGKGEVVRLSLSDGETTLAANFPMAESVGPLDSWQPGQVRRAVYHLPTSPRLTGNKAQVSVALLAESEAGATEIPLADVALATRSRQFDPPAIATPLEVAFGNEPQLKLIGFELKETTLTPDTPLSLTLYWQGVAEMKTTYTVFVQLLNSAGQVVAQVDAQPLTGAAPTTTWLPGEILTDPYTLTLPAELPPGDYRLIAGLYNAASGERLPVATGADFVELLPLTVK